jgi:hypothetical protein
VAWQWVTPTIGRHLFGCHPNGSVPFGAIVNGHPYVVFGQKFPGEKGSVRLCIVMMQQPVLLSQNFRTKSSHILTQSPWKITVVCGIDCLACQDKFFVNNPLDVKENDEHALDFAHHLSCLFWSRWIWTFPLGGLLLSLRVVTVHFKKCILLCLWYLILISYIYHRHK